MRLMRPHLLLAAAIFAALAATPPARGEAPLHAGPMLGYVTLREAAVWLQTTREATVQLRLHPESDPARARLSAPVRTRGEDDFTATVVLTGLEPGTGYAYELYLDGEQVARPYPLRFTTQPLWRWRTDPPQVTVLFGSCAYINEEPYDRPGAPYGGDFHIFETMAATPAELMLWLGDNVYTREVDFDTPRGLAARYRHDRALPQLQRLLAAMPHLAIWDDHDFGPNDADRSYQLRGESLAVFARYWPAIRLGLPEVPGVFQKFSLADVDFFLLDDRYHRTPNRAPRGPHTTMLGPGQLQWLRDALAYSRARFKVVALGNQVLNPHTRYEGLVNFPADYQGLLEFIRTARIEGVVFLSGDRHHSELIRLQPEGSYPLYDFTSSPLTAGPHKMRQDDPEKLNPDRVPGTLLEERAFGSLTFTGRGAERRVILRARAADGTLRWEREILARELSFPASPGVAAPPDGTQR